MQNYDAVIFDLDGTLLDTERLVIEAGADSLKTLGIDLGADFLRELTGHSGIESRARVSARLGAQASEFYAHWNLAVERRFDAGIPLMAGAHVLLAALPDLPRAVATNSGTDHSLRKLRTAKLLDHFQTVVGFDAVAKGKPAPDVYLEAARRLEVAPARCLAFEDSDTGVAAALAAGMTVVQVPDQHHSGTAGAHHVASSLIDGAIAAGLNLDLT